MKIKKNFGEGNIEINNNFKKVYNGFNVVDNEYNEQKKSKKQTSDGVTSGSFPFFTSSNQQSLFDDEFMIDGSYLILGDGGDYPSLNYYNGKFSYSSHTLVLDYVHNDNLYMYYYWLKNINELDRCFQGSKLKNIKRSLFIKTKILVPSIENQKKISMILDQSSLNIKKIKELVERIEIRNKYYADELLDGKSYIENNKIFKNIKFTKPILIDTIINDLPKSKLDAAVGSDKGEYRFFKSSAETYWSDDFIYDVEAIVMADGGKANVEYYNGKFSTSNHVYVFNSPLLNNKYFYYLLKSKIHLIDNCFQGAALKNLSKKQFKQLELNIFEEVEYQNRIVFFLDNLNNEKEKIEKLLHLEKQRFEWLSDKLLSGEYIIED